MAWLLGAIVLAVVATLLRRVLRLNTRRKNGLKNPAALDPERQLLYRSVALEVETQAAILGVSLNDAFEERDSGHPEIAWRLVQLSVGEWDRLSDLLTGLLRAVATHTAALQVVVPFHGIVSHRFKSAVMVNYVRLHELLDQLVFGSNLRFKLRLRVVGRAVETLTNEFRRMYAEAAGDGNTESFWHELDPFFHDFDLISKESLLALRALLLNLPSFALPRVTAELQGLISRGVRSTSVMAGP